MQQPYASSGHCTFRGRRGYGIVAYMNAHQHPTRRHAIGAVAAAVATAARPILGANDRVNLAIVGLGGRGRNHIEQYSAIQQCRIASKEIDAVSIATPEPLARAVDHLGLPGRQGRLRRKAGQPQPLRGPSDGGRGAQVRRIVQVGSQSRSIAHKQKAMQMLHEGVIGESTWRAVSAIGGASRSARLQRRSSPFPPASDWDLFLGPAPMRPIPRTASPTTGTGSGTPATATSATRACTRWTSAAGALTIDPATRRFVNDEGANRMLTRDYRPPYEIPESV
jgi:hypothetical protein